MNLNFISVSFLDFVDVFFVAFLMFQVYELIKKTVAINIFVGLFSIYLLWLLVKAMGMNLLSDILGQFIGLGMIALIIVFQQEVRRFLLLLGINYSSKRKFSLERLFSFNKKKTSDMQLKSVAKACRKMAFEKTGALIIMENKTDLSDFAETGNKLNADISIRLIENIFFKNSPLHDGGMIISGDKIDAASCILPISENTMIPAHMGLRHRAAIGITEITDAFVIIVSEETGTISYAKFGEITTNIKNKDLHKILEKEFD